MQPSLGVMSNLSAPIRVFFTSKAMIPPEGEGLLATAYALPYLTNLSFLASAPRAHTMSVITGSSSSSMQSIVHSGYSRMTSQTTPMLYSASMMVPDTRVVREYLTTWTASITVACLD